MSVWLKNLQSKVPLNVHLLKLHSSLLLQLLCPGSSKFTVSVVCVDSEKIQHLNKVYRHCDLPTDVLSFPYHENLVPGVLPKPELEWDFNLGDIILGMPVISDVCASDGVRLVDRLPVIVTHGLCHLIGYRHGNDTQWNKMYHKELSILTSFNNAFGTKLQPLTETIATAVN